MSGVNNTFVNPTGAMNGARALHGAGQDLWNTWIDLLGKISAANGAAPWGNDAPGKEFNKNYLGGEALATKALDVGMMIMPRFKDLGTDVAAAVTNTVDQDDIISAWFKPE